MERSLSESRAPDTVMGCACAATLHLFLRCRRQRHPDYVCAERLNESGVGGPPSRATSHPRAGRRTAVREALPRSRRRPSATRAAEALPPQPPHRTARRLGRAGVAHRSSLRSQKSLSCRHVCERDPRARRKNAGSRRDGIADAVVGAWSPSRFYVSGVRDTQPAS